MSTYYINGETLTGMADAIRNMRYESGEMTPAQMIDKISATTVGFPINVDSHINESTGRWQRPSDYPDLDSITMPNDFDGVYMTYDIRKCPDFAWIGVYATTNSGSYYVDRGHLQNGVFIVDETHTVSSGGYFRQTLNPSHGNVQLWRMICVTSGKHFTQFGFVTNSATASEAYTNQLQPCVERIGYMDYAPPIAGDTGYSSGYKRHCTMWMERDALVMARKVANTNFSYVWYFAFSLQELDLTKWDVSLWKVTQMRGTFSYCMNLRTIDMTDWDTSKWAITKIDTCFNYCCSLRKLDLSTWNTSNWAVTTISNMFYLCYSLEELDISTWDTSKWVIPSLSAVWYQCSALKSLDLSGWDTSKWTVTSLSQTWYNCYSLEKLDISTWDTSNWAVTTLYYAWSYNNNLRELRLNGWNTSNWAVTSMLCAFQFCHKLETLEISDWDTSNWAVTTMESAWSYCFSLKSLDLSTWDTSNWAITSLANTWNNCRSLTSLNVNSWNTSNWAVTTVASFFNLCASIKTIDLSNWDTSNWAVTTMSSAWNYCLSLNSLLIGTWDTSKWALTNMYYTFYSCISLRSLDIHLWNTSKWNLTDTRGFFNLCHNLRTLLLPASFPLASVTNTSGQLNNYSLATFNGYAMPNNHSYSNCYMLSRQSLLDIFNKLPTVSTTKTLTLGAHNQHKVTAEELAIATQKGWTIA